MTPNQSLLVSTMLYACGLSVACTDSDPAGVAQTSSSGGGTNPSGASGAGNGGAGTIMPGGSGGVVGGSGGSALTGYCGVLDGRIRECALIGPGRFTGCVNRADAAEACEAACLTAASCAEISEYFCGGDALLDCYGTCIGEPPVSCSDGESYPFTYRCDGITDCLGGEDETGCPAGESFRCRNVNQRIDTTLVCDGNPDCSDASDESPACALITCADGEQLPADYACDGFADCLDASDEPSDCAMAMCP